MIPGGRTGVTAKLGQQRVFKFALPETASNHYILYWLNGRALDSGQTERQLNLPVSAFSLFLSAEVLLYVLLLYTHGGIVGC